MESGIVVRGDHPQRAVAHVVELVVVCHVASADQLDAGLVHAAFQKLLHHRSASARRHKNKHRIGFQITHFLQERREVGVAQWHAQRLRHLPAVEGQAFLEEFFGVDAGAVVADQRDDFLDAVFRCPVGQRDSRLRQGKAGAHDIRRCLRDAGRGGGHHDLWRFGLRGNRRRGQRRWRDAKTGQYIDLVVYHQLLRQALGDVGHAGVVLQDQFNLFAGHRIAVLRHVKPRCRLDLPAGAGLLTGHRQNQANLEGVALRTGACAGQRQRGQGRSLDKRSFFHACLRFDKSESKG